MPQAALTRWALPTALAATLLWTGSVLAVSGVPAQQGKSDRVRLTAYPQGVFRLTAGPVVSTIQLKNNLAGCWSGTYDRTDPSSVPNGGEASARVIDLVSRGGAWYLTFQASLQSNCNVQGMCGAATDTTLIWLKLTPALNVAAKQSEVIQDCMAPTTTDQFTGRQDYDQPDMPLLELRRGLLQVVAVHSDYTTKLSTATTIRYLHASPERGFAVTSRQVPQK